MDATVVLTRNRVRLLSTRRRPDGAMEVRLAERLASVSADDAVDAIAGFVLGDAGARAAVRALFDRLPAEAGRREPRAVTIETSGRCHELTSLAEAERTRYFPASEVVPVTWARRRKRWKPQRTIRLGTYDPRYPLIRIHRRLDHPRVPGWFIGFVIFHEYLHHALGVGEPGGRRVLHSAEFRRRECLHHAWADVQRWEQQTLPRLLDGTL